MDDTDLIINLTLLAGVFIAISCCFFNTKCFPENNIHPV